MTGPFNGRALRVAIGGVCVRLTRMRKTRHAGQIALSRALRTSEKDVGIRRTRRSTRVMVSVTQDAVQLYAHWRDSTAFREQLRISRAEGFDDSVHGTIRCVDASAYATEAA